MTLLTRAYQCVDSISGWPLIRNQQRREYEGIFAANKDANLFRGVFDTFDAAQASAPATRPLGYDNSAAAAMYMDRTRKTYPTDYPVMFWLQKLFSEGCARCFDLGGHIGVSYYAYRRYLNYPATLKWTVQDVPAVVEQGKKIAIEKDRDGYLSFANNFQEADGCDVLMAQGSLQYLPDTLAERLQKLSVLPKHLILNLTPLHDRLSYFTLQSIGAAFCPYRITAILDFTKSFEALGYKMIDHWNNPDKSCPIPFYAEHSLDGYHGFYFRQEN
jgi:putative methyltransferase (TIGR04325 family)